MPRLAAAHKGETSVIVKDVQGEKMCMHFPSFFLEQNDDQLGVCLLLGPVIAVILGDMMLYLMIWPMHGPSIGEY
eukprot:1143452-Pelagomonas_calceolata.AAC.3